MYEEKWVLATLKRELVTKVRDKDDYCMSEACGKILALIATIEADAILGTPEMIQDTVDKLLDASKNSNPLEKLLDFKEVK